MDGTKEPILSIRHLSTPLRVGESTYNVVEDLSFDLHLGKTLAIVGESGCGKTLTALSLLRILPSPPCLPPEGEVLYKGQNLLDISEKEMRQIRGAKIAMIFQDPANALNPVYTIGDQLLEMVQLHLLISEEEGHNKVICALEEVGIPDPEQRYHDYPHQMSGGMRQRVMIAMALICEPDILIADEPTTALDVTIQKQVLDLICNLQKKKGMALLLITHDMGIVAEMAHEVIVMYTSQAIESGPVTEIFDAMAHPYTKGLFNSRPTPELSQKKLYSIPGTVPMLKDYPAGCRFHPRCPYAMEKCKSGPVPVFSMEKEGQHLVKCWLYDNSKESQEKCLKIK